MNDATIVLIVYIVAMSLLVWRLLGVASDLAGPVGGEPESSDWDDGP
jgi:hypothetical protein